MKELESGTADKRRHITEPREKLQVMSRRGGEVPMMSEKARKGNRDLGKWDRF